MAFCSAFLLCFAQKPRTSDCFVLMSVFGFKGLSWLSGLSGASGLGLRNSGFGRFLKSLKDYNRS